MRAHALKKYGKTNDLLVLENIDDRAPAAGEVRVRIKAFAINPVDRKTCEGESKMILPFAPPFVPGVDLAGVIEAVGPGVSTLKVGDAVFSYTGMDRMGAFAESITIDAVRVAKAPKNVSMAEAAALPLPALCALQAIRAGRVGKGSRVLIHGGAGAVGSLAVQLCAHAGAHVLATASAADADRVRALGAHTVIDYRAQRFEEIAKDMDVVFDTIGGETLKRSWSVVKRGGTLVTLHAPPAVGALVEAGLKASFLIRLVLPLAAMGAKQAAKKAGARFAPLVTVPDAGQLAEIAAVVEAGALKTTIDRRFGFEELGAALNYAVSGKAKGRVVVEVAEGKQAARAGQ